MDETREQYRPDEYLRYRADRRRRFRLVAYVAAPGLAGLTGLIYSLALRPFELDITQARYSLVLSLGLVGMSVMFALMLYLQRGASAFLGSRSRAGASSDDLYYSLQQIDLRNDLALREIRNEIEEVRGQASSIKERTLALPESDRQAVIEALLTRAKSEAAGVLLETIRAETRANQEQDVRLRAVDAAFSMGMSRLGSEVASLNRRGNLNLVLGIMTTVAGLGVLTFMVFKASMSLSDTAQVLGYYLPRISLALFIEVFAYFFLRLYKQSLAEIKYFQNELTNLVSCL